MDEGSEDHEHRGTVPSSAGPQDGAAINCAESLTQSLLRFVRPYCGSFSIAGAMLPPRCSTSPPSSAQTSTSSTRHGDERGDESSTWFQRLKRKVRLFQRKEQKGNGAAAETERLLAKEATGRPSPRSGDAKGAAGEMGPVGRAPMQERNADEEGGRGRGRGEDRPTPMAADEHILHVRGIPAVADPSPTSASVRSIRTTSTASHFGRTRSGNRLPSYRSHRSMTVESTASNRAVGARARTKSDHHSHSHPWTFLDHAAKLPPKLDDDRAKLTVVLDLDETIVFARDGPVYVRPYAATLLGYLREYCEVIVWTAGTKTHAKNVLRVLDPLGLTVKYCIYFSPPKFQEGSSAPAGDSLPNSVYDKDLRALGRSLDSTILIDNTAECCTSTPENTIIVADYRGPSTRNSSGMNIVGEQTPISAESTTEEHTNEGGDDDVTLLVIVDILKGLIDKRQVSGVDEEGKYGARGVVVGGGWGSKAIPLHRPLKWSNRTIDSEEDFFYANTSNPVERDASNVDSHSPFAAVHGGSPPPHHHAAWSVSSVQGYLRHCPLLLRWDVLPADSLLPVTMNFLCTDRWEGILPTGTSIAGGGMGATSTLPIAPTLSANRHSAVDTPPPPPAAMGVSVSRRRLKGPGCGSTSGWIESFRSSTNRSSTSFRSDGGSTMPPSPHTGTTGGEQLGSGLAEHGSIIHSDRRVDSSPILRLQSRAELMASDSLLRSERRKRTKN